MAQEAQQQDGGGKPKRDLAPLFGLAMALVNLAVVGYGAFLVYSSTLGYQPPKLTEEEAFEEVKKERENNPVSDPIVYTMETFTVNLAGTPRRTIRFEVNLEMLDEDGFEEVVQLGPRARDEVVRILNEKTYADLETIQGKLALKDQIAVRINSYLKNGVVKDIYFSDFVVQ